MTNKILYVKARVSEKLKRLVKQYLERGVYTNEADLIRGSIREKIQHDAPGLHSKLLSKETGGEMEK
jgi:Arc/MetJ-type ribon-helix-helix transcriptional regulator